MQCVFHAVVSVDVGVNCISSATRDAYSAQQVPLNKQQIWCGGAYLDCYHAC